MAKKNAGRGDTLFFLGASLAGLVLLPLMTFGISLPALTVPWQRQTIGAAFSVICLLGALAGISPSTCSRRSRSESQQTMKRGAAAPAQEVSTIPRVRKRGHHATCASYSAHVVHIGDAVYCAGCTGLVLGAGIALGGSVLYFFVGVALPNAVCMFCLGIVGVALGLLQHPLYALFKTRHGVVRVLVNIGFVVGAFLLLVSVTDLTGNLLLEVYLLLMILYWIFTRIAMSRRSHRRICTRCGDMSCPLSEARRQVRS